ncbi:MAG: ATP-binding protein [Paludibacteraceae bacterium]|nr:ATP-binding protein [Paludibacteraceae bacterium]
MLDAFYQTHKYLVEHVEARVRRRLMDEINWSDRLIGIKGCRGVGKTTFLLTYAKEHFGVSKECLYVNLNNFYFTKHSLPEFAGEFVANGGKTLLLDQIFKYPDWSHDLRQCYRKYPSLHIVFTGSTVMRLTEENPDLQDIVHMYNLRGLSFREYLNLQAGKSFPVYSLQEIINEHEHIAKDIAQEVNPLWYFPDYLHHGYYPFFLEPRNFTETLLKTMNMMLEVDILLIKQIDIAYLEKIRQLLYILLEETPCTLNVSRLSEEIDTSRATIMNYIKYLKDARLLNLLYTGDKQYPQKPQRVYMQNTNLLYALPTRHVSETAMAETFFYNALHVCHKINATDRSAQFIVDEKHYFNIASRLSSKAGFRLTAVANTEIGSGKQIPLWLFGFLY